MARGPKKHLKRLNAPKNWMLDKLTGRFVRSCLCVVGVPRCAARGPSGSWGRHAGAMRALFYFIGVAVPLVASLCLLASRGPNPCLPLAFPVV